MRIIIAGSRGIHGPEGVKAVKEAIRLSGWTPTEIISGGARGVDKIGEEIAEEMRVDLVVFPANWKLNGKSAGFKRNKKMLWYANLFNLEKGSDCPDKYKGALIAVWNGTSSGTKSMIELAKANGLPHFVHKIS